MIMQDPKDEGYVSPTLEAHDLVFGDRQASYGHPLDDFSCTALMWTAYLRRRGLLLPDDEIVAEDIGPLLVLLKMSRQAGFHNHDNLVDGCGYCETTERVIFERARRIQVTERLIADLQARRLQPPTDLHEDTFRNLLEKH